MPQLSQIFDAYPSAVTLDGNGNGTIAFAPNGSNVSVSRLFVSVATAVKQATVTLYKGSLSSPIGTIVSGSTGGLASGQLFLSDGTTLYVVWTGGDPGALATATFSGRQVNFSDFGADSITWIDPIAASDGSLIFPAIKSPNYQAGVDGWTIDRNGSAEFNDITVRGSVDITSTLGSEVIIDPTVDGIQLKPDAYSGPGTPVNHPAIIRASSIGPTPDRYGQLSIVGAYPDNVAQPVFGMASGNIEGTHGASFLLSAVGGGGAEVDITGSLKVNGVAPGTVTQTVFSGAGSFTYTPPTNCKQVFVECIGAGGAGGGAPATAAGQTSAGAGGGGGGYAAGLLPVALVPAASPVTVGAGGAAVSGALGLAGGSTIFGTAPLVSAGGGGGGNIAGANTNFQNAQGGGGGVSTAGFIIGGGTSGTWGARAGTTNGACFAGVGGASAIGGGGSGGNNADGQQGHSSGGGGGGSCNNPSGASRFGGAGADGVCIVTEYY